MEPQVPVSFQVRSRFPLYLFRRLRCAPAPEKDAAAIGAILEVPFASAGFTQHHQYVSALASLAPSISDVLFKQFHWRSLRSRHHNNIFTPPN
ncbi:MAG TPA: hypothetical protein DCW95_01795 [Chryseobacterium sp.]|nr:hypothetical protein [Chryseobacterium sp.]